MQFAVALAIAELPIRANPTPPINVLSIDTSNEIIGVGRRIWTDFKEEVQKDDRLVDLSDVCDSVIYATMTIPSDGSAISVPRKWLDAPPNSSRWISAIHTVYKDNVDQVGALLQSLFHSFNPNVSFITSQGHQNNKELASELTSFLSDYTYDRVHVNIRPGYTGPLPRITEWRCGVLNKLESSISVKSASYLRRDVRWENRDTNFLIFGKS